MEEEKSSFDFMLWELLHRSFRAVNKVRERELDQWGLTSRKSAVLRAILRLGERATATEIHRQLFLEASTISEQLKRMKNDGLIRRAKSQKDGSVRLEVTQKGYELYLKSMTQESIEEIMSVLTHEEKTELWSILSKMREKAVKELAIRKMDLYPPADYSIAQGRDTTASVES